jgi:hypothetical protein
MNVYVVTKSRLCLITREFKPYFGTEVFSSLKKAKEMVNYTTYNESLVIKKIDYSKKDEVVYTTDDYNDQILPFRLIITTHLLNEYSSHYKNDCYQSASK